MEHECMSSADDQAAVRVGAPEGWVRLWKRTYPYDDETLAFCAEIGAMGMTATLHGVTLFRDEPEKFVAELAQNIAGWSGTKAWQTPSRDVRIEAEFRTGGHVDMRWTLAPWRGDHPWTASVTVRGIEAGEEIRRLAQDMRELLG